MGGSTANGNRALEILSPKRELCNIPQVAIDLPLPLLGITESSLLEEGSAEDSRLSAYTFLSVERTYSSAH
jgi:hypothetical protein